MKSVPAGVLLLLLLSLLSRPALAQSVAAIDFSSRTVRLDAPATRIVALAPHSVENLYSAGAGDRLVGVVSSSDYPAEARKLPRVGSFSAYSLETIASLQPDLIILWGSGNGAGALGKLQVLGIPIFVSEPRLLDDIPRDIRALGTLAGSRAHSEASARRFERGLAALRAQYSQRNTIKVLYEIWNDPLQTINAEHLISQVITLCGGVNIFADAPTLAPRINIESVLARAPQAIVASGMSNSRPHWLDDWKRFPSLPAVSDNGLFFVHPDLLERPTARVLEGAGVLCSQLDSLRD